MTTQNQWSELDLKQEIQEIIKNEFKFTHLMPVQKAAIPLFIKNYDVAVEAQTGSGKTLAFLIPLFQQLITLFKKDNQDKLFGLIISPSRELAQQIFEVAKRFNQSLQYKICICIGGSSLEHDIEYMNKQGCNILIGTPGKLRAVLDDQKLSIIVKSLEYLILDEADRLMSDDYAEDLKNILAKLPKQRRTGLFSATLSSAKIHDLMKMGLRNPVSVKVDVNSKQMPDSLSNYYIQCNDRTDKTATLIDLIKQKCFNNKSIIFFNTCASVVFYNTIFSQLDDFKQLSFSCINGQMKQKKRNKIFQNFKSSDQKSQIILTTDVLARGIDFEDVPLVIQFDPPQDPSFFIHRSGRTARSGRVGEAIILLESNEKGFISFLNRNQINIKEFQIERICQFEELQQEVLQVITKDRDIIEKGKTAFISFIRSYKEHKLQILFSLQKLNIGKVAHSFFLLRVPRIKEILGRKIDFIQNETNPNTIQFVDKNKEKQFNQKKELKSAKEQEKIELQKQVHQKSSVKPLNIKNNRTLRKKIKQQHENSEEEEMLEEQRLVKKLKSGKISLNQFKERMKNIDPEELESQDYAKDII